MAESFLMSPTTERTIVQSDELQMLPGKKVKRGPKRPKPDEGAKKTEKNAPADRPPASAESEVARRIPVKTNARTNEKLRLRLEGRGNEVRMRVAQVCGMGVTVRGLRRNLTVRI